MDNYPKVISEVRKLVQSKYPKLDIRRGDGYYYWFSDDENLSLYLANQKTTSVSVFHVSNLSYESWMIEAGEIMQDFV